MEKQTEENEIILEVSLPNSLGLCYIEAALKVGIQELSNSRQFMSVAGNTYVCGNMSEGEESLLAFLECVTEAKQQFFQNVNQSSPQGSGSNPISNFPAEFVNPDSETDDVA